jgi:hypothetical protein
MSLLGLKTPSSHHCCDVGDAVGRADGSKLGDADGRDVGSKLGDTDGRADGSELGYADGLAVAPSSP